MVEVYLHSFSDTSENGYGLSYLRQVDDRGELFLSLVMGKLRVDPLKAITIPRLELVAATLSANMSNIIENELQINGLHPYIFGPTETLSLGIQRRRKAASKCLWLIGSIKYAPYLIQHIGIMSADYASRGISLNDADKVDKWLHGPPQLKQGHF